MEPVTEQADVRLTDEVGHVLFEGSDEEFKAAAHRVSTHQSNGGLSESVEVAPAKMTIGEAMRRAVEELGPVTIDASLSASQLRQLADCYEDVVRRKAAFNEKADEAKTAKKSLESATELLLEKVRSFTHPSPLPLFDQTQAESDVDDMTSAVEGALPVPSPEIYELQHLLMDAGAVVLVDAILGWTPEQQDEARKWAGDQIAATAKEKPGHTVSLRWPDHVSEASARAEPEEARVPKPRHATKEKRQQAKQAARKAPAEKKKQARR